MAPAASCNFLAASNAATAARGIDGTATASAVLDTAPPPGVAAPACHACCRMSMPRNRPPLRLVLEPARMRLMQLLALAWHLVVM